MTASNEPTPGWPGADRAASGWRRWRIWWTAGVAVALLGLGGTMLADPGIFSGATRLDSAEPSLTVAGGGRAPPFSQPDLAHPGDAISLAQFRGRPVVVNFWASWCVPCRREMPLLEQRYRALRGRVAFLGVNTNDARGPALAFLRSTHVGYPSTYDPDGSAASAYGLVGLPTTVFVTATGRIAERRIGILDAASLGQGIDALLGSGP